MDNHVVQVVHKIHKAVTLNHAYVITYMEEVIIVHLEHIRTTGLQQPEDRIHITTVHTHHQADSTQSQQDKHYIKDNVLIVDIKPHLRGAHVLMEAENVRR